MSSLVVLVLKFEEIEFNAVTALFDGNESDKECDLSDA